jgi:hypothetical protein
MMSSHRQTHPWLVGTLLMVGIFGTVFAVSAAEPFEQLVVSIAGGIFSAVLWILGNILVTTIDMLLKVGMYNNFLDTAAVQIGWKLVRDICNLGFVVGMLLIAFGTVLNIGSYHAKSRLTKLLLMAILINFSKGITGFLIDISQVVMLTFLQATRDAAAGNITAGLKLFDMLSLRSDFEGEISTMSILGAYVLAVIMIWIAIVIVLGLILKLLYRIVSLWVLVIFSPVAYVASVVPGLSKYGSQWWGKLGDNLTSGPVIAFFLWLAMSIVAITNGVGQDMMTFDAQGQLVGGGGGSEIAAAASEATSVSSLANYFVMIIFLTMALQFGAAAGDAGAKAFGNLTTKLNTGAVNAAKGIRNYGVQRASEISGVQLSPSEWVKAWQANRTFVKDQRRKRTAAKGRERGGLYGALGSPQDLFKNYWNFKGLMRFDERGRPSPGGLLRGIGGKQFTAREAERLHAQADADDAQYKIMMARYQRGTNQQWMNERTGLITDQGEHVAVTARISTAQGKIDAARTARTALDLNIPENNDVNVMIADEIKLLKDEQKQAKNRKDVELEAELGIKIRALEGAVTAGTYDPAQSDQKDAFEDRIAHRRQQAEEKISELASSIREGDAVTDRFDNEGQRQEFLDQQMKPLRQAIDTARRRAERVREPEMYYALQEQRSLRNEELKKIQEIKDSDHLTSMFRDAQALGDVARAEAIVMKLAQDANFNDILMNLGYDSDAQGMQDFFEKEFGKKMGTGKETILSLAQDVSYVNEDKKHFELARVVKGKRGKLEWMSEKEHADAVVTQVRKVDLEELARRANRQAYGYESAADGQFHFSRHGLQLVKENYKEYISLINGNRFGKNTAQKFNDPAAQQQLQLLRGTLSDPDKVTFDRFLKSLKGFSGKADAETAGIDPEIASIFSTS